MQRQSRPRSRHRRGVEAVEAAITLPLLTLVLFGTIEITHRWHVEKMLKIATYEAMKAGAAVEGSSRDALRVFREHTNAMGIRGAQLEIDRFKFDAADPGDRIRLEGTAATKLNESPTPQVIPLESEVLSGGPITYYKEGT